MWPFVCAALAAAGGCVCGDPTLLVDLTVAPRATTTQCVQVVVLPAGKPEKPSDPIARPPGKDAFQVAVLQGNLPESVDLVARGFDDPGCTRLNEESIPNSVRFIRGQPQHVPLALNGSACIGADAGAPCPSGVCRSDQACVAAGGEIDCTNGVDDDGDGKADCADPDCFDVACTSSANLCMVGTKCLADGGCASATFKACDMPPAFCLGAPGTCSAPTGVCSYAPDAGIGCDDGNQCTNPDHCLLDAGCGGDPIVCNTPPGACYSTNGSCDLDAGCIYPVRADGGCDDGNLCTFNDRCSADAGCAGTTYSCSGSGTQCSFPGSCLGDGGCSIGPAKTGQLCDGGTGVCNASAVCLGFPYVPSNFKPSQIAPTLVLPDGGLPGSINLSCNAWFNSTDGGMSWCNGEPLPSVTPITQNDGTTLATVLGMTGLTVSGSLQVFGTRPVILAVWGDVNITSTGTVSARSALGEDAGAGAAGAASCGAQNGGVGSNTVGAGGGGGSYTTAGGNGGDLTGTGGANGGNGGASNGNATIIPLRGGCSGGNGGRANDANSDGSAGGLGGGAVQISAAGTLTVNGTVTASGAGGQGGLQDQVGGEGGNGGGGGGSGGAVLLEGDDTNIPSGAKLTASGGGGGEGGHMDTNGAAGVNGGNGPTTASGGGTAGVSGNCGGDGTAGGFNNTAPTAAANITYATQACGAGGGGGAAGKIRVNGHASCTVTAGVQSPTPSFGAPCP